MEKIIIPSSWNFNEEIAQIVKYSSSGLVGKDYSILVKRAGEEAAHWLKNIELEPDVVPVHLIALGSKEGYGPNRNGDGFKEASLIKFHNTFVKHAKYYRQHRNKDPEKRYGIVKTSFYNKDMRRVELLAFLNANKKATEKYGGYVADKELDLIHAGKPIPVSMACHIEYDVCSGCGNKAKKRAEYCTEKTCKYGGCKDNLTKVAEDGHILHVDNPEPDFFDISTVVRPADRIAFGGKADYLSKAASASVMSGAELAELYEVQTPFELLFEKNKDTDQKIIKLAYELSLLEDKIGNNTYNKELARALNIPKTFINIDVLGAPGTEKFASGFKALLDENVILPVKEFVQVILGNSDKVAELSEVVPALLPGIYKRLLFDNHRCVNLNKVACFYVKEKQATLAHRTWARKLNESGYAVTASGLQKQAAVASIRNNRFPDLKQFNIKYAAENKLAEEVAGLYAAYKLAYLLQKNEILPFTKEVIVLQNYI